MTKVSKVGSLAIVGEGKKGSSTRVTVAGLAMLVTLLVGTARNATARQDPKTRSADLKMSVRVYNYAGSSANMLRLAESETERIFANAGVHLEWNSCTITSGTESADSTCAAPLTPLDLRLRIVESVKLMRNHAEAEIAGYTVGDLATVQMAPLLELARPPACFPYQALGLAIAHELGHALLGPAHSSQGIMKALWGKEQLDLKAAGEMVFTPVEIRALRLAVKARTRQSAGTENGLRTLRLRNR